MIIKFKLTYDIQSSLNTHIRAFIIIII